MALSPQKYLGMPRLETPFVSADVQHIQRPWHDLLTGIVARIGGGFSAQGLAAFVQQDPNGGSPFLNDSPTGTALGKLGLQDQPGAPVQLQVLGASPFQFHATTTGLLVADGGTLTIFRNGVGANVAGGAMPLAAGDVGQVAWVGPAPTVNWLPRGTLAP